MYTHCQMAGFIGHWWISLLCAVLKDLRISQGPLLWFQLAILIRQVGGGVQEEHTPLDAFWGRGPNIPSMVPEGLASYLWNLKGGTSFLT